MTSSGGPGRGRATPWYCIHESGGAAASTLAAAGLVAAAATLAFLGLVFAGEWALGAVAFGVALVAGGNAWAAARNISWFDRGRPAPPAPAPAAPRPPVQPVPPVSVARPQGPLPPGWTRPGPPPPPVARPATATPQPTPRPATPQPTPRPATPQPVAPEACDQHDAPTVVDQGADERPSPREAARSARVRVRGGATAKGRRVAGSRQS
ncbi:hypothetical protein WCD74_28645 [Actinomycetospora sp. OC33-EN08]|uniref:Uncharacterized protein n=1 Tax=Actinomycetospora aurantiaca TaxID=3129233 RepID=A0ABU8MWR2_9PSEU